MVNRVDLERLIVLGLDELRRAEADLDKRFRKAPVRRRGTWPTLANSVNDLKVRAERLEALLGALEQSESHCSPLAA